MVNQVPQPWHPQGVYVHEAALAVKQVAPDKYADFVTAHYKQYDAGAFKDDTTFGKSRKDLYAELLGTAGAVGVDTAAMGALLELLPEGGNCGNLCFFELRLQKLISGPTSNFMSLLNVLNIQYILRAHYPKRT